MRRWLPIALLLTAVANVPAAGQAACGASRDYWPTESWRTAAPAAEQVDTALLDSAMTHWSHDYPKLFSVMIVRHGYIVAERYYGDHDSTDAMDLRSATKSIVSALVGIAIDKKILRGVDQTVGDLFPEYFVGDDGDSRKKNITVRQLLTMTSGLDWEEFSGGRYFSGQKDWVRAVLSRPLATTPGEKFNYSSGNVHVLSAAILRRSNGTTLEFANQSLFAPLGFHVPATDWGADPQGINAGGAGLRLTTRELGKIGWLYINQGCWAGTQVVPASWVSQSVEKWSDPGGRVRGYGYLWWLSATEPHAYTALGFGGQYIYVAPDQDAVIVLTADPMQADSPHFEVIPKFVLPALR